MTGQLWAVTAVMVAVFAAVIGGAAAVGVDFDGRLGGVLATLLALALSFGASAVTVHFTARR